MLRDVVWSDDGMYKVGDVYNPERFFSDALNNSSEFVCAIPLVSFGLIIRMSIVLFRIIKARQLKNCS